MLFGNQCGLDLNKRDRMSSQELVKLQTKRLVLYSLSREQLDMALNHLDQLAEVLQIHISPDVFSEESRQAMMIKISRMDHVDRRLHPWYTYFLMVQADTQEAIGVCGFKGTPSLYGWVELGYAIQEAFRNQGFMTETVQALIEWAFRFDSCLRVTAETLANNYASQHVLQKAGLTIERKTDSMIYWKIDKKDYFQSRV
jgi:RimJ/RimL family protein N-acetyltransferase